MKKLETRIRGHDKDIEAMCNCHYQGFADCIHELFNVRSQATSLKNEIHQVNQEVQKAYSTNILRKADELIKYRRIVCNTQTAIEHLQECLPVLDTFSKLQAQMKEKKYYSALKTLDHFETVCMPKIAKYRFAQVMVAQVPKIRETIKNESMKDLKDFLENIRQLTSKIGEIAMRNTALQHKSKEFSLVLNSDHYGDIKGSYFLNNLESTSEKTDSQKLSNENDLNNGDLSLLNEELSATDIVDFSPVYRCLHIFGCLGARDQFENYYRQQRQQQAVLILQSISSSPELLFTAANFRNYLFGVVGFFVIEDHLLNTSSGLVTKQYLESNWDYIIKSLVEHVQSQASMCTDAKQMLYLKSFLMLFFYTVQSYGYSIESLMKLLVELRQLYIEVLLRQWAMVFMKIFDSDNYHPLVVNNQQDLEYYFSDSPFLDMDVGFGEKNGHVGDGNGDDDSPTSQDSTKNDLSGSSTASVTFPRRYPFSSFVPKVFKAVKEFIVVSLEFTHDLNINYGDIEDSVRKSTNLLLTRTLSDALSSLIKKPNLGLLQLIQISINSNYLEETSTYLEVFISKLIHNKSETSTSVSSGTPAINQEELSGKDGRSSSTRITTDADFRYLKHSMSFNNEFGMYQSHLARLQGRSMFKDARSDAESQIYTQLNKKIDEFFDLSNYDYLLSNSPGKASSYILDLMAFLASTFEAFTNLPTKVAQTACLSACKYISSKLLNILLEEDVKAISHGFLQQFNLDLVQCEMFAGSEPVKDFEDGALQSCFLELRQIMDLFVEFDSWATYFADYGKNESRYLRVNPQTALILLEKLIRGDQKKTIFSSLSKNERDKKNKVDTILKKLKTIIANQSANS